MGKWADLLLDGKYKGVKFDFVSTRDQHANILDVQEFPGRNGAFVEKKARKALRFEVLAVFIEDDYPDTMNALIAKLDDGTPGTLVHPVFGSIQASAEQFVVLHDAEEADSGTIQIAFIEHTENADEIFTGAPSIAAQANDVRTEADGVSTAAAGYVEYILTVGSEAASLAVAYTTQAYLEAANFAQMATEAAIAAATAADTLEIKGPEMAAAEIQAYANGALSKIDAVVRALADYTTDEAYELSRSLLLTAASLQALAKVLLEAKPPLITVSVAADIPLLAWVHAFYGDSSRVDEVMLLNDFLDPLLIPAGTEVRCYAV